MRIAAFIACLCFCLINVPEARAQDASKALTEARELLKAPKLQSNARFLYLRSLVDALLDYRIATKPNGYEGGEDFEKPAWQRLNEVLYQAKSLAQLKAAADNNEFPEGAEKELAEIYSKQASDFASFTKDFGGESGSATDQDILDAMALYATANVLLTSNYHAAGWFTDSYVWPFCWPRGKQQ
ncbi:hypothetical protein [Dongia sp.]|uniref:hypothetical protein n=1 Tax=Dongia sp. TaxID=1977262 RepID=UPI0037517345